MQIALPHPIGQVRQLAPFVLLSLLLHVALLFFIRPPARNFSVAQPHPIEVYLSAPPVYEQARIPDKTTTKKQDNLANLRSTRMKQTAPLAIQPDATSPTAQPDTIFSPATTLVFNPQQLMESAKSIAQDEARKTERHFAEEEKKKLSTPAGALAQFLRQPHEELRLANGMLKIITDAGAICFQPVPYFARDTPGLYGIPTTCP